MHHQKLVVLGLVAIGKRYGFEMEEFIARTQIHRWAEIGNSTVYKMLKDLRKSGDLDARPVASDKGPRRTEYSLTSKGRETLEANIRAALKSDKAAKLDRLAGLFFSPLLPGGTRSAALKNTLDHLDIARTDLRHDLGKAKGDMIAEAIIGFYIDVNEAECEAIRKVHLFLEQK